MAEKRNKNEIPNVIKTDISSCYSQSGKELADNDFLYSVGCTTCQGDGVCREAEHFCYQCGIFMCSECVTQHARFPILKIHDVGCAQEKLRDANKTVCTTLGNKADINDQSNIDQVETEHQRDNPCHLDTDQDQTINQTDAVRRRTLNAISNPEIICAVQDQAIELTGQHRILNTIFDPAEVCAVSDQTLDKTDNVNLTPAFQHQTTINKRALSDKSSVDSNEMGSIDVSLHADQVVRAKNKMTCPKHEDELLKVFCVSHEDLCCCVCEMTKHRSCQSVVSLKEASQGMISQTRLDKLPAEIETLFNYFTAILRTKRIAITNIEEQRITIENSVTSYKDELVRCLNSLACNTIAGLQARYDTAKTSINNDIVALNDILRELKIALEDCKDNKSDEYLYFITLMQSMKLLQSKQPDLKIHQESVAREYIVFSLCGQIKKWLSYFTDLGEFQDKLNPVIEGTVSASLKREYTLAESIKNITDVLVLDKNDMVVAVTNPNMLLFLDATFQIKEEHALSTWQPNQICEINRRAFAIALEQTTRAGKVLVVSVGNSIKEEYSFFVGQGCRGVAYSNRMLFVTRGGRFFDDTGPNIHVFNLFGSSLRAFVPSELTIPRHIVESPDKRHVYIADEQAGLIKCDLKGNIKSRHRTTGMKFTSVLAKICNEHVFFIDNTTNVFYMDIRKEEPVLLLKTSDVASPRALFYDCSASTLTVFCDKNVKVYELETRNQASVTSD